MAYLDVTFLGLDLETLLGGGGADPNPKILRPFLAKNFDILIFLNDFDIFWEEEGGWLQSKTVKAHFA